MLQYFGKAGRHFYWICRGIDRRPVLPNRIRKSIGAENTFSRDLTTLDDMRAELDPLVDKVWHYCESIGVRGRTVTLKVKFANFQIITRSRSYIAPISDRSTLASISEGLLAAQFPMRKGVRLLGVSLSSLGSPLDGIYSIAFGLSFIFRKRHPLADNFRRVSCSGFMFKVSWSQAWSSISETP